MLLRSFRLVCMFLEFSSVLSFLSAFIISLVCTFVNTIVHTNREDFFVVFAGIGAPFMGFEVDVSARLKQEKKRCFLLRFRGT